MKDMAVEYEYKRISFGAKTHNKTLMYRVNNEGLKGWELFNRYIDPSGVRKSIFHFRKKKLK